MRRTIALLMAAVLSGTASLTGCASKLQTNADVAEVQSVTQKTYVADAGRSLTGFEYLLTNEMSADKLSLTPEDFKITFTMLPDESQGETEKTQQLAEVSDVEVQGNIVSVVVKEVPYSSIDDTSIDCTNDIFDCKKEKMELDTKTADDFEKSVFTASDGTEITYYLYMPEDAEKLPLMVWEHGGGEVLDASFDGANLVANRGAVAWVENGVETAVLSVQYPTNYSFGISEIPEELHQMEAYNTAKYELIEKLIADGKLDANRIYISGASSGGGGALRFMMQYPDLFAGALVICPKDTLVPMAEKYDLAYQLDDPSLLKITDEEYQESYKQMEDVLKKYDISNIPIWFAHAENDPVCTSYTSIMANDILSKMGGAENRLTLYTDQQMQDAGQSIYHFAWVPALNDKEMLDWVYAQSK